MRSNRSVARSAYPRCRVAFHSQPAGAIETGSFEARYYLAPREVRSINQLSAKPTSVALMRAAPHRGDGGKGDGGEVGERIKGADGPARPRAGQPQGLRDG